MKSLRIVLALITVGAAVAGLVAVGCGPQQKFCPDSNRRNFECVEATRDSGGQGDSIIIGNDAGLGDSIFIGGDM